MLVVKSAKRVLFWSIGIYTLFIAMLFFCQKWIIFKAKPLAHDHEFAFDVPHREVTFSTQDGGELHGVLFKADKPKGVVLFYHGQGWDLSKKWRSVARDCLSRDHDVFVATYRGFGKSRGTLSYKTLLSDAVATYEFLAQHYPAESIVVYGRSLGTGPATYVASMFPVQQLILESPYYSLLDTAISQYPVVPKAILSWILRFPIRTDQWIRKVVCPIHIFHSSDDAIIPVSSSRRLVGIADEAESAVYTEIDDICHDFVIKHPDIQSTLDEILGN